MECGLSDSSGTDDDLPARHQNRFPRAGRAAGNVGSAVVITAQLSRMNNDMETQIHHIEQEAYSSVLRAFKAQSDAISWHTSAGLTGRAKVANQGSSGPLGVQPSEAANFNPLIGRKVWTRWPEDNNFYEAVIVDYNSGDGRHALVYDIRTADETWEWVNLKEISAEDIQWEDPGISHRGGRSGRNRGFKKPMAHIGATSRGRGTTKHQPSKDLPSSQKKALGDIEILNTDTLIKEVEKVFSANQPNPKEVEKAKKVLKEHEQALVDAIATLEDASDDGERQLMEQDDQCRNQNYHSVIGEGGPDGNKRDTKDGKAGSQAQEQQPQESTALKHDT